MNKTDKEYIDAQVASVEEKCKELIRNASQKVGSVAKVRG